MNKKGSPSSDGSKIMIDQSQHGFINIRWYVKEEAWDKLQQSITQGFCNGVAPISQKIENVDNKIEIVKELADNKIESLLWQMAEQAQNEKEFQSYAKKKFEQHEDDMKTVRELIAEFKECYDDKKDVKTNLERFGREISRQRDESYSLAIKKLHDIAVNFQEKIRLDYAYEILQGWQSIRLGKFDVATDFFNRVLRVMTNEAEAYFGLYLANCKIQVLWDYAKCQWQPICHDTAALSDDQNLYYESALLYAQPKQKSDFEAFHADIDYVKSEFERLAGTQYDCFICVKISDNNRRTTDGHTSDSKKASELYKMLKVKNMHPFYSEENVHNDIGGNTYEGHILYALYKAKCMLVVCSKREYLNSPWVKNEYTRYMEMIKLGDKNPNSIRIVCLDDSKIDTLPGFGRELQFLSLSDDPSEYDQILDFVKYFVDPSPQHTGNGGALPVDSIHRKQNEAFAQTQELTLPRKVKKLCDKAFKQDTNAQYKLSLYLGSYLMGDYSESVGLCEYKDKRYHSKDITGLYRDNTGRFSICDSDEGTSIVPNKYIEAKLTNYELALFWLQTAANKGNEDAQVHLGRCYRYGVAYINDNNQRVQLLEKNFDKAYDLWLCSAQSHPAAGYYIWRMLSVLPQGQPTVSTQEAQKYLEISAEMNYPPAVKQLHRQAEQKTQEPPVSKGAKREESKLDRRYSTLIDKQQGFRTPFKNFGIETLAGIFVAVIYVATFIWSLIFSLNLGVIYSRYLMPWILGAGGLVIVAGLIFAVRRNTVPNYTTVDRKYNSFVRWLVPVVLICLVVAQMGLIVGVESGQNHHYFFENVTYEYFETYGEYCARIRGSGDAQVKDAILGKRVTMLTFDYRDVHIDQLTIGRNIKEIYGYGDDWSIQTIQVARGNDNFVCESGCVIDTSGNLVLAESREAITIPSSVTSIGYGAFRNCSGLQTISFEGDSQLQSIGDSAFRGCSSLTEITIPSSVTSIGDSAFRGCSSLKEIIIPSGVTSIGYSAFRGCSSLQTISFEGDSQLQSIGYEAFYDCSSLTEITIPSSVTSIGYGAFKDCEKLTIYCEVTGKPAGWASAWNPDGRPVVWGYKSDRE